MADIKCKPSPKDGQLPTDPAKLYRLGLAIFEGDGYEKDELLGADIIAKAAELGDPDAKYWIDDYTFDDDACVQGEA